MAIDHVTIKVKDLESAKKFYTAALAPIGYAVIMEFEGWLGLGASSTIPKATTSRS